jgi:hypothetical protein
MVGDPIRDGTASAKAQGSLMAGAQDSCKNGSVDARKSSAPEREGHAI